YLRCLNFGDIDNPIIQLYKKQRNYVVSLIRSAKSSYYTNLLTIEKSPKKFWKIIRKIIPSKKASKKISSDIDVNLINTAFVSESDSIASDLSEVEMFNFDYLIPQTFDDFTFPLLTLEDLKNYISKLSPMVATGCDNISSFLLKKMTDTSLSILVNIINQSFKTGIVPTSWKLAKICPIPKKGIKEFRPISVLSNIAKIAEKHIAVSLSKHMNDLNYFSDYQFAFRENFSTQCMCLSLQHDICKSLDQKKYSVMVSIDLRKAFDT
ncbi:RNA-directed DNA polymerase from mobile element jockey-like protein, partial [Leptotrombidium deliense]